MRVSLVTEALCVTKEVCEGDSKQFPYSEGGPLGIYLGEHGSLIR